MSKTDRRVPRPGVEWEFDRVRITDDGIRRVILRRKIIRAVRTA